MIQKVSHIILSFLLLLTTTGLTISSHYCGNRLVGVTINSEAEPCCDMEGRCCQNVTQIVKVNDNYTTTSNNFSFEQAALIIPVLIFIFDIELQDNLTDRSFFPTTLSPPPIQTVLACLQTYLL